jgi:hypothetical protein
MNFVDAHKAMMLAASHLSAGIEAARMPDGCIDCAIYEPYAERYQMARIECDRLARIAIALKGDD